MANISEGSSILDQFTSPVEEYVEPGYEGKIDYRIRQLSYSARQTLSGCKRKFQLNRLKTNFRLSTSEETNVTFAFGHIVGDGIQKAFEGKSENQIIFALFTGWHAELFVEDTKRKKSFWYALRAVLKFLHMRKNGYMEDWELLEYNNRPATELSFVINLPDGFRFRGSVDLVLKNKNDGGIRVIELKTSWMEDNPNKYKNSSQAIGYSVVLDVISPGLSSYEVLYLVYNTTTQEYTPIVFPKSYFQRALWIRELLFDIELIKTCEEEQLYPMNGDYCLHYNKECEFMHSCTMDTSELVQKCTEKDVDNKVYDITLSIADLLNAQLERL